jgi:hypothetical protein
MFILNQLLVLIVLQQSATIKYIGTVASAKNPADIWLGNMFNIIWLYS